EPLLLVRVEQLSAAERDLPPVHRVFGQSRDFHLPANERGPRVPGFGRLAGLAPTALRLRRAVFVEPVGVGEPRRVLVRVLGDGAEQGVFVAHGKPAGESVLRAYPTRPRRRTRPRGDKLNDIRTAF